MWRSQKEVGWKVGGMEQGGKGPGLGEEEGGGHAKQILILQGGTESRQLQCRFQVLTIGPPRSSLIFAFSNSLVLLQL